MNTTVKRSTVAVLSALVALALLSSPASAAPSCIAQVNADERAHYGTAWGQVVATVARNPELFPGATSLGDIARVLTSAPKNDCPAED